MKAMHIDTAHVFICAVRKPRGLEIEKIKRNKKKIENEEKWMVW